MIAIDPRMFRGTCRAIWLFGSASRSDTDEYSDVDVLQVGIGPRRYFQGGMSISTYSLEELVRFAEGGSLFVGHLLLEAVPLYDPEELLLDLKASFRKPSSYDAYRIALKRCVPLLDVKNDDCVDLGRITDIGYFILRSYLFSQEWDEGRSTFSILEIAKRRDCPELEILRRIRKEKPSEAACLVLELVARFVEEPVNLNRTVEAHILNSYPDIPLVVALGLRLLAGHEIELEYEGISDWKI